MTRPTTLPRETEKVVLSYLKDYVPKTIMSQAMKAERIKLLNKEWTIEDWAFLLKNFSEKEIIRDWFGNDKFAFDYYKQFAHDKIKMKMLVEKGLDPLHVNDEDLDTFMTNDFPCNKDHSITRDLDKEKLGTKGLDFEIDMIVMNQFNGAEFTPEGLQTFAEKHGHSMTLQNATTHAEKLNKMLRKIRMTDPRKTGIVDMENEMIHQLKKYAKKNHIDSVTTNMMVVHGKRMISILNQNAGRNIAKTITQNDERGVMRWFIKTVKSQAEFLNLTLNDVASQLINSSGEEEA